MTENVNPMNNGPVVSAFRGDVCENIHFASAVVSNTTGNISRMFPNSKDQPVFLRSSAKPFQAFPLSQHSRAETLSLEEWAIICASHSANPRQIALVHQVLEKAQATVADLQCGPHAPMDADEAKKLLCSNTAPTAIHSNCSGKHAGMLLACRWYGWPWENYLDPSHPLQQAILKAIQTYSDAPHVAVAGDGCGAPVFALPMHCAAILFSRFVTQPEFAILVEAMTNHPELVGDANRFDTLVMQLTQGQVVAKVGAEGFIGMAHRGTGEGLVLKVHSGDNGIRDRLAVAILKDLGWLTAEQAETLWAKPQFAKIQKNLHQHPVGHFEFHLPWVL